MLLLGQPFINANTSVKPPFDSSSHPLLLLADVCRGSLVYAIDVLEKAILLLRSHADITCIDGSGNNFLHCVLEASWVQFGSIKIEAVEAAEKEAKARAWMVDRCDCDRCNASFQEPKHLLKAAIAAGANIYLINDNGKTPTMVAEVRGRNEEWFEALEECGIDVEEVLLHTTAWEIVLSELKNRYSYDYSSKVKAKIVEDFDSRFWNLGNIRQHSSLSFEEFCEQRDARRKWQVDCDYAVASKRYREMLDYIIVKYPGYEGSDSSEEDDEKFTEILEDIIEDAPPYAEDEVYVQQSIESFESTKLSNEYTESDNYDRVVEIFDCVAKPVENDDVVDTENFSGNNRDPDMADIYCDDPFDLGADGFRTPPMDFNDYNELMDLDI